MSGALHSEPIDRRGSWSVDQSGAFNYRYDLRIPPGVAGVQPNIALTFNSNAGVSTLGQGFALTGLSSITRCPKTPATDGVKGWVSFDNTDPLCLDGARLMLRSGSQGQDGAIYEPEVYDGTKVIGVSLDSIDESKYFEVQTKTGEIRRYKKRIALFPGGPSGTLISYIWSFDLESVSDSKGNFWQVYYAPYVEARLPRVICYTGNSKLALKPSTCIEFGYGPLTGPYSSIEYQPNSIRFYNYFGRLYTGNALLRAIRIVQNATITSVGTARLPDWSVTGQQLQEYKLSYAQNRPTDNYFLASVTECTATSCLPSLSFSWNSSNATQNAQYVGLAQGALANLSDTAGFTNAKYYNSIAYPDINGDGRLDVCYRTAQGIKCSLFDGAGFLAPIDGPLLSDAAGWDQKFRYATITYVDINRDGKADICAKDAQGIVCWLSNGSSFTSEIRGPSMPDSAGWNLESRYSTISFLDLNQDGFADVCGRDTAGIVCWYGNGSGFDFNRIDGPALSDAAGWGAISAYSSIRFADINGDGIPDLCAIQSNSVCYLGIAANFQKNVDSAGNVTIKVFGSSVVGPTWPIASGLYMGSLQYLDLNTDGTTDACIRASNGFHCTLASGVNWSNSNELYGRFPSLTDAEGWSNPAKSATIRFADINHDQFPDLCFRQDDRIKCYLGTITSKKNLVDGPVFGLGSDLDQESTFSTMRFVDLNGDGRPDFCLRRSNGLNCFLQTSDHRLTLASISVAGHQIFPESKPLSATAGYTWRYGFSWPNRPLASATPVTTSVRESDGLGGFVTTNYSFSDGYYDAYYGRGFLGFASRTEQKLSASAERSVISKGQYLQNWPCIGYPYRTQRKTPAGVLIEQIDTTWKTRTPSNANSVACTAPLPVGQTAIPFSTSQIIRRWELTTTSQQGTELPRKQVQTTVDAYGNVLRVTEQILNADGTASGYSRTTENLYDPDAERSRQGRLIRSSVTQSKP
ncbi:FG-GAP-like repeat-containing protein [Limnobacter humi]|uniref:FG-GAP-like repeat-containing protein n=1 Tax=Limnobacter humi TaxID=1778671 RepID=A0ABT1WDL7_9BURK|nr:FG-GAP-like repeat-containing protein [Limnobacter humi]MCQ8895617.1 FG-GAP-like repeat-containing protein [Limnobacter humi]